MITVLICIVRAALFVVALSATAPAQALEDVILPTVSFSATATHEFRNMQIKERIFYRDGKLRVERGPGFSVTILDLVSETEWILMVNRTYLVLPLDNEMFRRFVARPLALSGARKRGSEQIGGLHTTKYDFGDDGEMKAAGSYWLTDTGIMVRRAYEDGVKGMNMRHRQFLTDLKIKEQPETLFQIPPGYTRAN